MQRAQKFFWSGLEKRDSGDDAKALVDFNQAILLNPRYADAYSARSSAKFNLADFKGSIDDLNQVLLITPGDPAAFYSRGLAKLQLGDREGAIHDFGQAIKNRFPAYDAYYQRGLVRLESGDPAGAIKDFTESTKFDEVTAPAFNSSPYRELGMARMMMGDVKRST